MKPIIILRIVSTQKYVSRTASWFWAYRHKKASKLPPQTSEIERAYIWFSKKEANRAFECFNKWWIEVELIHCSMKIDILSVMF